MIFCSDEVLEDGSCGFNASSLANVGYFVKAKLKELGGVVLIKLFRTD